jgi:lipopolysaccharide/colanic/teichoic acid biosynthesis glycosyltransferase
MDVFLSGMALLAFLPFGLAIAAVLRLTGEGEVFYVQTRVGKGGKNFGLLKFATMLRNSPALGSGMITVRNDPRVLPFGRFLRMTKLNEMPQLVNILKGDMSIVGPRPLVRGQHDFLPEEQRTAIYSIQPGLTGIGSIVFRDEERLLSESPKGHDQCYREDIMPLKAKLELWYAQHKSLPLDCALIALTAWAILVPDTSLYRKLLGSGWDADFDAVFDSRKLQEAGRGRV